MGKILQELPGTKKNVPLKEYTTFKIGGPAKYFFAAKNKEDLVKAIKISKKFKIPIFIFGLGSNVLVSDKGFNGLVIKMQNSECEIKGDRVFVGAGAVLSKLAGALIENKLSGLEWASGIPGTVGGAVYGNAQAFGVKMSDAVESVEAIDKKTLKRKSLSTKECRFSLKNSIFKRSAGKNLIIISVVLKLKKADKEEIRKKVKEFLDYRKKGHPVAFPSAGSVFVNPENKKGAIHAGYLIEKSGLKGKKIGKAQISEMHANFIINLGGAEAKDVLRLINLAKAKVKKTFKRNLETEIRLVGF